MRGIFLGCTILITAASTMGFASNSQKNTHKVHRSHAYPSSQRWVVDRWDFPVAHNRNRVIQPVPIPKYVPPKKPLTKKSQINLILPTKSANYFEAIAAGGFSTPTTGNFLLQATTNETDALRPGNATWNFSAGQLGLGFVYFFRNAQEYSDTLQWFPSFEPELNFYFNHYQNKGEVYRFENAAFNDLTYNLSIKSMRLMLDGSLTVVSWRQLSTYFIAGFGNSWKRIYYSDMNKDDNPCQLQNFSIDADNPPSFAWEAGIGEIYNINDRFKLSFQYLYTTYGQFSNIGMNGHTNFPYIIPDNTRFHTQTLLLGLHVKL